LFDELLYIGTLGTFRIMLEHFALKLRYVMFIVWRRGSVGVVVTCVCYVAVVIICQIFTACRPWLTIFRFWTPSKVVISSLCVVRVMAE